MESTRTPQTTNLQRKDYTFFLLIHKNLKKLQTSLENIIHAHNHLPRKFIKISKMLLSITFTSPTMLVGGRA